MMFARTRPRTPRRKTAGCKAGYARRERRNPEDRLSASRRPLVGLVLGGGAARGFAHIGILRALLARGIVPDVVVGTSIGAAVGGAYVTGHLDAFEDWARSLQPRSVFSYIDIQLNGSGLIGGGKSPNLTSIGRRQIESCR